MSPLWAEVQTTWTNTHMDFSFSIGDIISILGIVATFTIAWQTFKLQKFQTKTNLFEERNKIHQAAFHVFSNCIVRIGWHNTDEYITISNRNKIINYLDADIANYITQLYDISIEISRTNGEFNGMLGISSNLPPENREQLLNDLIDKAVKLWYNIGSAFQNYGFENPFDRYSNKNK